MNKIQKCASCGLFIGIIFISPLVVEPLQEKLCNERCRITKAPHNIERNEINIPNTLSTGISSISGTTGVVLSLKSTS